MSEHIPLSEAGLAELQKMKTTLGDLAKDAEELWDLLADCDQDPVTLKVHVDMGTHLRVLRLLRKVWQSG